MQHPPKLFQYDDNKVSTEEDSCHFALSKGGGEKHFRQSLTNGVKRESKASKNFSSFCKLTSLHGWQYIGGESGGSISKHMFWLSIVCMSMIIAFIFLYNNTKDFMNSTVVTTVDTMTVPLTEIFFPSVVVCNINQVRKSFFDELGIHTNESLIRQFYHDYIGGQEEEDSTNEMSESRIQSDQLFQQFLSRMNQSNTADISINWVTHQKCKDMFLFSKWNRSITYGYEIERDFGTDYGICCWYTPQLNFTDIIEDMNKRKLHEPDWGHWFTNIAKGAKTGKDNGYTMLFDIESFDYSYYKEGSEGLKVALVHHLDMPIMRQTGFHVGPGTESQIAVTPTLITISPNAMSRFTPSERDCYSEDEISLKYLPRDHGYRYEMSNCLFEAAFENILKECKCFPGFHTMGGEDAMNKYEICVGENLTCMNDILNQMGQYEMVEYKNTHVRCRSSCDNQQNSLFVTTSAYPNKQVFMHRKEFCILLTRLVDKCHSSKRNVLMSEFPSICTVLATLDNHSYCLNNEVDNSKHPLPNCSYKSCPIVDAVHEYARKNLVKFNIFIKDPYAKRFQKDEKITKTSYIANSGGLLGLCMGFSLISGAEIIYHMFFGLFHILFPRRLHKRIHEQLSTNKMDSPLGKKLSTQQKMNMNKLTIMNSSNVQCGEGVNIDDSHLHKSLHDEDYPSPLDQDSASGCYFCPTHDRMDDDEMMKQKGLCERYGRSERVEFDTLRKQPPNHDNTECQVVQNEDSRRRNAEVMQFCNVLDAYNDAERGVCYRTQYDVEYDDSNAGMKSRLMRVSSPTPSMDHRHQRGTAATGMKDCECPCHIHSPPDYCMGSSDSSPETEVLNYEKNAKSAHIPNTLQPNIESSTAFHQSCFDSKAKPKNEHARPVQSTKENINGSVSSISSAKKSGSTLYGYKRVFKTTRSPSQNEKRNENNTAAAAIRNDDDAYFKFIAHNV